MEIKCNLHLSFPISLIIADNVKALKDCWLIGDNFLADIFPTLQRIKSDTPIKQKQAPYIYDYYNIFSWTSPLSDERSTPARILNSFTEGLNKIHRLPKYVLVLSDKDILDGLQYNKNLSSNIEYQLSWLVQNISKLITRRCDDLKDKRPGALTTSFEPMVVWVKCINRPDRATNDDQYIKAANMSKVFNHILEETICCENYMYILDIESLDDTQSSYFKTNGRLADSGKEQYWKELDFKMKKFDRRQMDLKPISKRDRTIGDINVVGTGKHRHNGSDDIGGEDTYNTSNTSRAHHKSASSRGKKVRRELEF